LTVAEEKKVPRWVRTGNPADAHRSKEDLESQQEEPQEQGEVIPPPVSEDVRQENERQHIPWTPPSVSEEEHKRQIEEVATKAMPVSEGNAPPDRSIVAPAPPPEPAPLDPQHEQALRLREIWGHAQAMNPEGMPVSGVQVSDATVETEVKGGVEITTLRLGQNYVAGPDASEQPHGTASKSGELPRVPCPHCDGRGELPFGWIHNDNGDAA
jgi:hypothetical protein